MATIINEGATRRVAISADEPTAGYAPVSVIRGTVTVAASVAPGGRQRAVVEILHNVGGMVQRALVGGEFVTGPGTNSTFAVGASGPLTQGQSATCASALGGRPLVPGLPDEFAESVLAGLTAAAVQLPGGALTVDRAAYDERGSSRHSFGLAARLLVDVLVAQLTGQDPGPRLQAALRGW